MSFKIEEQCFFINDNISIMIDSLINNKVMWDHILFSQFNLTNVRRSVDAQGLWLACWTLDWVIWVQALAGGEDRTPTAGDWA